MRHVRRYENVKNIMRNIGTAEPCHAKVTCQESFSHYRASLHRVTLVRHFFDYVLGEIFMVIVRRTRCTLINLKGQECCVSNTR